MNLIKEFREYIKSRNEIDLGKIAKREATDFFNIEKRDDKTCITFRNVVVHVSYDVTEEAETISTLFILRKQYYLDRINKII